MNNIRSFRLAQRAVLKNMKDFKLTETSKNDFKLIISFKEIDYVCEFIPVKKTAKDIFEDMENNFEIYFSNTNYKYTDSFIQQSDDNYSESKSMNDFSSTLFNIFSLMDVIILRDLNKIDILFLDINGDRFILTLTKIDCLPEILSQRVRIYLS